MLGRSRLLAYISRGGVGRVAPNASFSSSAESKPSPSDDATRHSPQEAAAGKGVVDPRTGRTRRGSGWHYGTELAALTARLGFREEGLPSLLQALTLKPFTTRVGSRGDPDTEHMDNSRLSALGSSALQLYLVEHIYCTFPQLRGQDVLSLCEALTNPIALTSLAERLGVVDLLRTAHRLYSPTQVRVIGQSMAAVVGAVYADRGPKAARELVRQLVVAELVEKDIKELICLQHPKLVLKELLKHKGFPPPVTRLVRESGRLTHFPTFVVGVYSGDKCLGEGAGTSIKRAESEALTAALRDHLLEEMHSGPLPSDIEQYKDEEDIKLFWSGKDVDGVQENKETSV